MRFVSDITDDDGVGYGFSVLNYRILEDVEEFSDWTLKDRSQSYLEWIDERKNSHGMILYPWDSYRYLQLYCGSIIGYSACFCTASVSFTGFLCPRA